MNIEDMKEQLRKQYPYRVELHAHCSPAFSCGDLPPEEVVRIFHHAGHHNLWATRMSHCRRIFMNCLRC